MNRFVANLANAVRHPVETYRNDRDSAGFFLLGSVLELSDVGMFTLAGESTAVFVPTSVAFVGYAALGLALIAHDNDLPEQATAE